VHASSSSSKFIKFPLGGDLFLITEDFFILRQIDRHDLDRNAPQGSTLFKCGISCKSSGESAMFAVSQVSNRIVRPRVGMTGYLCQSERKAEESENTACDAHRRGLIEVWCYEKE
jgi:hypothetical protein